ncbi:MAG TPA: hypothetical protein PK971_13700, partial [Saprospiraceae bacterium]|nr:hypothetical protein [Saprospiraceae bacterium]
QISFWAALVFFALAAVYICENRLIQNGISSLSLDQENLDMLLAVVLRCKVKQKVPPLRAALSEIFP